MEEDNVSVGRLTVGHVSRLEHLRRRYGFANMFDRVACGSLINSGADELLEVAGVYAVAMEWRYESDVPYVRDDIRNIGICDAIEVLLVAN
jgi:hypothetical protein